MKKIIAVAIDEYSYPGFCRLHNCLNDVTEIINILKTQYLFDEVELLAKFDQTTRKHVLNHIQQALINTQEDDSILLIYAGHGQYNSSAEVPYWVPSDAVASDSSTWVSVTEIIPFIKAAKAKHISIISDSCFAGAIILSRGGGFPALSDRRSRMALASGGIESVSDGVKGEQSPFAKVLTNVLKNNGKEKLSFMSMSKQTIIEFSRDRTQTPTFGHIPNTNHEGGSFVFELRPPPKQENGYAFDEYSLDLNIELPNEIDYNCELPMFRECGWFDNRIVNSEVQHIAFNVISNVRKFILDEKDDLVTNETKLSIHISHKIVSISDKSISMLIVANSWLGGAYPTTIINSLNMIFAPERSLHIRDVMPFDNFQEDLKSLYKQFRDKDSEHSIEEYLDYVKEEDLDFTFDNKIVTLCFGQYVPRVLFAASFLDIPRSELKIKI